MKILAGIIGFVLALMFGAPFFGALVLGACGYAVMHWIRKQNEGADPAPQEAAQAAQPAAPQEEYVPDLGSPERARAYLRRLAERVRTLEDEFAALKGETARPDAQPAQLEEARQHEPVPERAPEPPAASPIEPPPAPAVEPEPVAEEQAIPEPVMQEAIPEPRSEGPSIGASYIPPEPPAPPEPPEPKGPSFFSRLVSGNIVAKVGAVILFFGVGFLLKYAYDRDMISPQLRLAGVAFAAIAVFVLGWKLRLGERRLYGLILQGVASGLAYLDVFFALKTYGFIGVGLGFSLFALLGVATTMLAVRQDAKPLAVLGLTGAFLAPVLASTGGGNHVFLFTYYLLLNGFIVAVSWFKSWRVLNITGWFFTLAVAAVWGSRSYTPALFGTVEPFLLAFFAIYLVLPILFATRQPPELKGLVDGTLVFGTPAAVAAIQAKLVWDMPYGLAWSAALGAALYGLLSVMVLRHQNMKLLGQTYIALAVGLGTLAIFYAFGAYTTFALWSIEGAAILWVCLRQNQLLGRLFGLAVQVGGAAYFALDFFDYGRANPWFNDAVLGCAIIATASFISASLLRRYRERITPLEQVLGSLVLVWGAAWWSAGGVDAIVNGVQSAQYRPALFSLFFSGSIVVAELAGAKARWPMLRGLTTVHALVLLLCGFMQASFHTQPLANLGELAWPVGLGSFFWVLHRQRRDAYDAGFVARYASAWVILAGVATWQAGWHLEQHEYAYAMAIAMIGYLAAALRFRLREMGNDNTRFSTVPMLWAMAFWYAGAILWIHHDVRPVYEASAVILFASASALAAEYLGSALGWKALRLSGAVHPAALVAAAAVQFATASHPFADYGWVAWSAGLGALFLILHRQRRDALDAALALPYGTGWLILAAIATWEALWRLEQHDYGFAMAMASIAYLGAGLRFRLREHGTENARLSTWPMLWATAFWFTAGLLWIHDGVSPVYEPASMILFVTANALVAEFAGAALGWPALRASSAAHPALLAVAALLQFASGTHPIADYGWFAWSVGLGGLFLVLHRHRRDGFDALLTPRYAAGWLILAGIATWEALWQLGERQYLYTLGIALLGYAVAGVRLRISEQGSSRVAISTPVLLWSMTFWFAAFAGWAHDTLAQRSAAVHAVLLFAAGSAALYELASRQLDWPALRMAARLPWLAIPAAFVLDVWLGAHPFSGWWGLSWPAAWLLAAWGLRREERDNVHFVTGYRHSVALYAPIILVTWELVWRLGDWKFGDAWRISALAVPASLALVAATSTWASARWPLDPHWPFYRERLLPLVAVLLALWSLAVNLRAPGPLEPLAVYVPLLNPIDIAIAVAAFAVVRLGRCIESEDNRAAVWKALAVLGFVWVNGMALRTIHYWADVPYRFQDLANSVLVQATLSILWTSGALALMLIGRHLVQRKFWIVGGALLAVVVGKLFLVDLANTGTVARIVSFVGVGVILLIIGYVAPVPPGVKEAEDGA